MQYTEYFAGPSREGPFNLHYESFFYTAKYIFQKQQFLKAYFEPTIVKDKTKVDHYASPTIMAYFALYVRHILQYGSIRQGSCLTIQLKIHRSVFISQDACFSSVKRIGNIFIWHTEDTAWHTKNRDGLRHRLTLFS